MLSLALMLFLTRGGAAEAVPPTYQLDDTLTCNYCPPGTYMGAFCTATEDTLCLPCPTDHFTQFWNYLPKCLYCTNFCDDTQIVKEECSPRTNRVCECKEGYYWRGHICVKHTRCPIGFGAKQIGTVHRNTECERCPPDMFSAEISSRAKCINHTDCGQVILRGTSWHDNVCSTCTVLMDKGGEAWLREVLTIFFDQAKLKVRKLRRFVRGLPDSKRGPGKSEPTKQTLLRRIKEWIKTAHEHQLVKLPEMLQKTKLHNAAEQLDRMLKQFKKAASHCERTNILHERY